MTNQEYIKKIDFFRALAILLVVLYHLDLIFHGGFVGVDVFFVISGFIITRLITLELNSAEGFSFKKFYIKRARRLLPSLFLMGALVFISTFFLFSPSDFTKSTQSIFYSSVIISNFFFFLNSGYFDHASELEPLLHTWSLGIEEQFYLLWPITLVIIYRVFKNKLNPILLSILLASFLLTAYLCYTDGVNSLFDLDSLGNNSIRSAIFYLLPFRVFEFVIGALAYSKFSNKEELKLPNAFLNLAGLVLIILSAIFLNKELQYLGVLNIVPCVGIFLLLISKAPKFLHSVYNNNFLGLIGKSSYTWYLFHWPMIAISKYYFERDLLLHESIFMLVATLLISILIYKFFENPIRYSSKAGNLKGNKILIGAILLFVISSGFISYHVTTNNGWVFRLNQNQIEFASSINANTLDEYHKSYWGGADYEKGLIERPNSKNEKVDLILLGESHCGHLLHGIDEILVKKHDKRVFIQNIMNPSAIMLPDIIPKHLKEQKVKAILNKTIKVLKENPNATLVISHFWAVQLRRSEAVLADGRIMPLQNNKASYQVLMDKVNKLLEIAGQRNVILFGTGPVMPYSNKLNHIERMLKPTLKNENVGSTKFRPSPEYYKINSFLKDYVKNKPNLFYLDPRVPFCDKGECYAQNGNDIFLSDWDHLSKVGSLKLIEHYEKQILKAIK